MWEFEDIEETDDYIPLTEEEYDILVRCQMEHFVPKVEDYAKTHSEENCYKLTNKWRCDGVITERTEHDLDKYISEMIFR